MGENDRETRPTESEEGDVSPEVIWNVPERGGPEPPQEPGGIWREPPDHPAEPEAESPAALNTALSRLERLERSMDRLAEQLEERPASSAGPPAPEVAPRAVSEILRTVEGAVQSRLDDFTLEFRRGLGAVEKNLQDLVSSSLWQTDEDDRPLAVRVEDSLSGLRSRIEDVVDVFRTTVGDQAATQETLLGRVESVEEMLRELGERRGLRRLAQAEERLREQENAFVEQLAAAAERTAEEEARLREAMGEAFGLLRSELVAKVEEIGTTPRPEVQELTTRLGGFAEAVRESLQAAVDQLRRGFESSADELRGRVEETHSRLEAFEQSALAAEQEAIADLRTGLESLIGGLQERVTSFEQAAREAPQQAIGEVREEFMSELRTLQERVSGFGEEFRAAIEASTHRFEAATAETTSEARSTIGEAAAELGKSKELIDVRIRQFVDAFGSRMSEAETALVTRVSTELDRSLSEASGAIRDLVEATSSAQSRQQENLREIASRLEETLHAVPGALSSVRDQVATQSEAVVGAVSRMESLSGIIESLGKRRGFRELIESEQQVRQEQAALVDRLTRAGESFGVRAEGLEGRLESLAETVEEHQRQGVAREQELRQMTVALGQVLREALDRAESQLRTGAAEEIGSRLSQFDQALERRLAAVARNEAQVERISAGLLKLQVQVSETFADSMGELRRSLTEDVARQLTDEVDRRLEQTRTLISETVSAGAEANVQDLAKLRLEVREAMAGLGSEVGDLRTRVEDGVRQLEQETSAALSQLGQSIEKRFKALVESPKQAPARKKSTARKRPSRSSPETPS